jgi:hypothetical protein
MPIISGDYHPQNSLLKLSPLPLLEKGKGMKPFQNSPASHHSGVGNELSTDFLPSFKRGEGRRI